MSVDYYQYKIYRTTSYILAINAGFVLWITEIHVHIWNPAFSLRGEIFPPNIKFIDFRKHTSDA